MKESPIPGKLAICKGAMVMLVQNYVVKELVMNGLVGFDIDI